MSKTELMPCPFCGGAGFVDSDKSVPGWWGFWVICKQCGAEGAMQGEAESAVSAWNTRHFGQTLTNEIGASIEPPTPGDS